MPSSTPAGRQRVRREGREKDGDGRAPPPRDGDSRAASRGAAARSGSRDLHSPAPEAGVRLP